MIVDVNVSLSRRPLRRCPFGEPSRLVEKLRQFGVTQAWTGALDGLFHRDIAAANGRLAEVRGRYGPGLLVPFGSINPMLPDWQEDVRRCCVEHRMPGIRLHPNFHGYGLDDAAFAAILREAPQRGLLVQLVLRMDEYLSPFFRRDLKAGKLSRQEAVELVAAMMLMLCQLSGAVAVDWQSKKRTPNRYSHNYITLGGVKADGSNAVNDLSSVFLDSRRLVDCRDPALSIRYFPGIDREFRGKAMALMRDRLPVFTYNDAAVLAAQEKLGAPDEVARDYAHSGCMFCVLPGRDLPPTRVTHNGPRAVLLALNGGVDPLTGKLAGEATPPPQTLRDFESFFNAVRAQLRHGLAAATRRSARDQGERPLGYPLLARPLLVGGLRGASFRRNVDQCLAGVATTIDSLLAVREIVYRKKMVALEDLATALRKDFVGDERLRAYLMNRVPSYGSDDPDVTEMTWRVSQAWVEDVAAAGRGMDVVLRPAFYSWLYNIELGKVTGTTPDGRFSGEPLSSDQTPSHGHGRAPTEALRSIAQLSHDCTCSGGTTFTISPAHFRGPDGVDRLAALIEGYFAEGGLQLHFIVADLAMLRDAVKHPEPHGDLLVRVAGFSEYFVRLQPAVQQEIIRRMQQGTNE